MLFRLSEPEEENYICGLARLVKNLPNYELFYHLNTLNSSIFSKKKDLVVNGKYYNYFHSAFYGYSSKNQTDFYFFSNKSCHSEQILEPNELFVTETDTNLLFPEKPEVDYIIKSSDAFPDFSVISLPETIMFQIQNYPLETGGKLHSILQYYE